MGVYPKDVIYDSPILEIKLKHLDKKIDKRYKKGYVETKKILEAHKAADADLRKQFLTNYPNDFVDWHPQS